MTVGRLKQQAGGPMYQQVRQDLLARIRRGEFPPGSQLPSENQLCKEFGVSVTTARRAFLELVKEGTIYRKAGVGTMVSPHVRRVRLAFLSIDYKGDAWRHTPSAMGEIVAGLGEECWQRSASFSMTGVEGEEAVTYLRGLAEERSVDGILLRTADDINEELLEVLERSGMPYVVVKRHVPGRKMNCVISDDVRGARIATDHLLNLGHRRVGFVCAKPHITFAQERFSGYKAALTGRDVELEAGLVRQQPYFTMEEGYRAVRDLLKRSSPPSAIFVASDTMALGAYRVVQELGLSVPRDVSLVGYDDISPVSVLQPPLTTVRTSYYDFGRLAADLLLDIVEGREASPQQRIVEPVLTVRGSTAASGAAARSPSVLQEKAPTVQQLVEDAVEPGQSASKGVSVTGSDGHMVEGMMQACRAAGMMAFKAGERRTDTLLYCFRLGSDLTGALDLASTEVRDALRANPNKPENVVCVALADAVAEGAAFAASRAGLDRVVALLSANREFKGVRVNAVLFAEKAMERALRPAMFMASEDCVNGEVLVLKRLGGTSPRSW